MHWDEVLNSRGSTQLPRSMLAYFAGLLSTDQLRPRKDTSYPRGEIFPWLVATAIAFQIVINYSIFLKKSTP